MNEPTENPTPSAQDDIKNVLQNTLIEQAQTLLNFTKTEAFALQVPETDTHIMVGPRARIATFLGLVSEVEQPTGDLPPLPEPTHTYEAHMGARIPAFSVGQMREYARAAIATYLASQSQAAQPIEPPPIPKFSLASKLAEYASNPHYSWDEYALGMQQGSDALHGLEKWAERAFTHLAGTSQATKVQAEPSKNDIARAIFKHLRTSPFVDGDWDRATVLGAGNAVRSKFLAAAKSVQELFAAPVAEEAQAEPSEPGSLNTLLQIADFLDSNSKPQQTGVDTFDYASEFDYNLSHAACTIRCIVADLAAPVAKEAPAVPEGFAIVPLVPTHEMQNAYFKVIDKNMQRVTTDPRFGRWDNMRVAYTAMLAAAPAAPTAQEVTQQAAPTDDADLLDVFDPARAKLKREDWDPTTRKPKVVTQQAEPVQRIESCFTETQVEAAAKRMLQIDYVHGGGGHPDKASAEMKHSYRKQALDILEAAFAQSPSSQEVTQQAAKAEPETLEQRLNKIRDFGDDQLIQSVSTGQIPIHKGLAKIDAAIASGAAPAAKAETAEQAEGAQAHVMPSFAAPAEPVAKAEQVQWRNIQKVVRELADFCFGSAAASGQISLGAAHVALSSSLTAKDGLRMRLDPLPKHAALAPLPEPRIVELYRESFKAMADRLREPPKYVSPCVLDFARAIESEVASRFRAQGGNTNSDRSDLAPTTSTVSAPAEPYAYEHDNGDETELVYAAWFSRGYGTMIEGDTYRPLFLDAPSSTEGTQAAPEEVRNQVLEEAAKVCEAHGASYDNAHNRGLGLAIELSNVAGECAYAIRALRTTSTDQADTDTGSAT